MRTVAPIVGPDSQEIVARIFVLPSEDRGAVRHLGRRADRRYLNVPVYAAFHEWLGRGDALRPMWDAWKAGDRAGATEVIPDELLDSSSCTARRSSVPSTSSGTWTPGSRPRCP